MQSKNLIKRISYNASVIKVIRFFHLRSILRKIYYFFAHPKNNILEVSIGGKTAKFHVRTPDELRLAESVSGEWGEKRVIESLISNVKPGDVFYDVGANIGIYTVALANAVGNNGKVIAFDPEKESCERLAENIEINGLHNVTIVKKALGEKDEESKLYIGETTGNFSLVNIYENSSNYQKVEIVGGDNFVSAQRLPIPNLIKIDVEGYEYSVLSGLKKTLLDPQCRVICCEVHIGLFPQGITEDSVISFIKQLGFKRIETFKRAFSAYHIIAHKD